MTASPQRHPRKEHTRYITVPTGTTVRFWTHVPRPTSTHGPVSQAARCSTRMDRRVRRTRPSCSSSAFKGQHIEGLQNALSSFHAQIPNDQCLTQESGYQNWWSCSGLLASSYPKHVRNLTNIFVTVPSSFNVSSILDDHTLYTLKILNLKPARPMSLDSCTKFG